MRLLICLITYNRLKYTKRTIKSLLKTIDVPYYLVIVDNASSDGTVKWLKDNGPQDLLIEQPINFYPGRACNEGWRKGLEEFDATHLMRCDNDMEFAPGWASTAEKYFKSFPALGQLGLDNTALDSWDETKQQYLFRGANGAETINMWPGNVGGPCIIKRAVWDKGGRYDETPWHHDGGKMPTAQEDVLFSLSMHKLGYIYGHPDVELASTFADETNRDEYPEYYKQTMSERGYA